MNFAEIQENMQEIQKQEKSKHKGFTLSNRAMGNDIRNHNKSVQIMAGITVQKKQAKSARTSVDYSQEQKFPEPIKQLKMSPSITAMYTEFR